VSDGRVIDLKRADITEYVKRQMGSSFTAKDFRTWSGTLICACALARAAASEEVPAGQRARRAQIAAALRETAAQLGNTPAVCRSSYVCPSVLTSFEHGAVIDRHHATVEALLARRGRGLDRVERALLRLLKRKLTGRSPAARMAA